jgi:hypothetical protein
MLLDLRRRLTKISKIELGISALTISLTGFMVWRVSQLGLMKALTDQNAHLNFSKQLFDSLTPGISQLGFWPPLLHILMSPFVLFDSLYKSGLAGFFTLLPFLILGAVFLYRTCLILTKSKLSGFLSALLFLLNPYVLYYGVTPMMEVLFMANLFGVAYFMALWLQREKLSSLLLSGIFITLASLSRFEGLILIPLVGLIILIHFVKQRKSYSEVEASLILFGLLAAVGLSFILIYSWIFGGSPTIFASGGWWLKGSAEEIYPTKHNLFKTLEYLLYASFYMLGKPLVITSLISFLFLMFVSKNKFLTLSTLAILFSPFLFVWLANFTGSVSMFVPELPPFGFFHNDRHTLSWIGFVVMAPTALIGLALQKFGDLKNKKVINIVNFLSLIPVIFFTVTLGALNLHQFYSVVFLEKFEVIKLNINVPTQDHFEVARYLEQNYDFGKILLSRANNDPILAEANLPLSAYIYEGNYRFYQQVLDRPWLFSRWVIMENPSDQVKLTKPIAEKWANSDTFNHYYTLVLENKKERLYKIKEDHIEQLAREKNYDLSQIPSFNSQITSWDPQKINFGVRD